MRIRGVPALALLIAAAPAPQTPAPVCEKAGLTLAGGPTAPGIHRLDQEPPAREIKAVLRTLDGCNAPLQVRAEVGRPRR